MFASLGREHHTMQNARYGKLTFPQGLGRSVSIWLDENEMEVEIVHGIISRKPAERIKFHWNALVDVQHDDTTVTLYPLEYAPVSFKARGASVIASSIRSIQELHQVRKDLGLITTKDN